MKPGLLRLFAAAITILMCLPVAVWGQFSFGGYTFPGSAAFADRANAVGSSLILQNSGPSVNAALTDINLSTWVVAGGYYDMVDVYFDNNVIVNESGPDFVVFEYGNYPEAYRVAVSGNGTPGGLGAFHRYDGTAAIDLDDFGIAAGGTVNLLRFQLNLMGGSAETSADLQEVGALHSTDVMSIADAFTFDDGTTQGWTLVGAWDETHANLLPHNFFNGWKDPVNFPNPPGGDPAGDSQGSLQCVTLGGHGVTNPGHTWWVMEFHSPDLTNLPAWQTAKGFSVELAECMASMGILYENLFVRVHDLDQAKDRDFYNGTAKAMQHDVYGDATPAWNHDVFDWTSIATFPTRYVIKEIYVRIWGKMDVVCEGGVYLDQVVPILGGMPQVPAAPSDLQAVILTDQLHLTWQDHATDEDGFVLEKKENNPLDPVWHPLDTLAANTLSCQMDRPVRNRTYEFRVRAFNAHGFSNYSNIDTVMVFGSIVFLDIDSPNGGEIWHPGSGQTITWQSSTLSKPQQVTIDYSIDGGSRWLTPPIATVANSGAYTWTVPNTPSPNCILRVRNAANAALYDLSNKPFTISTQVVPVLSVAPQRLDFGTIYENLSFAIHNSGGGTLTWNAAENPDKAWLTSLTPGSGTGDDTVRVRVNRALLNGDKDSTLVTVTSNGGTASVKVLISKAVGTLPPAWNYTENTGQNAIVVLPLAAHPNIEGAALANGDIIGAFTPAGLCCGWRQWQGANLSITLWGDNDQTPAVDGFKAGEAIHFRLYRLSSAREWKMVQTAYSQGNGLYSVNAFMVLNAFDVREFETMQLNFIGGWNMFSLHIDPSQPDMQDVVAPLGRKLVLVKNGRGETCIPAYQINDIGDLEFRDGYQAYLNVAATLAVTGKPVLSETPIPLGMGWNLNSYLPHAALDAVDALSSITAHLVLAKNGAGKTYIPQYGINDIGAMQPGQGYQFYMNAASTLTYPVMAKSAKSDKFLALQRGSEKAGELLSLQHGNDSLHYHFTANTGENATVVLPAAVQPQYGDGTLLAKGDEIAILNRQGVCAGSAVWKGVNLALTVWGDDAMTDSLDGLKAGDTLLFCIWDHTHALEYRAQAAFLSGHPVVYTANGFSVISELRASQLTDLVHEESVVPTDFLLAGNYPNPFNAQTRIAFQIPAAGSVTLTVYDCRGEEVWRKTRDAMTAGQHVWQWHGQNRQGQAAASGLYFYELAFRRTDGAAGKQSGKMILMR